MDAHALHAVLRHDAELLAARLPEMPRADRPAARQLALRAWRLLDDPKPKAPALLALLGELHAVLGVRELGKPAMAVWRMRATQPWPEVLRRTLVADRVVAWQRRFDQRWQARVALSAARIDWLEARVAGRAHTQVATVRAPTESPGREPLELLHKRGRSRFS